MISPVADTEKARLNCLAFLFDLFPMLQLGQVQVEEFSSLGFRLVLRVWHMFYQEVQQRFLAFVGELAIGITPLAVVFVETAVSLAADHGIIGQRHPAALAIERLRCAQQGIDRHAEFAGQDLQQLGIGLCHAGFPPAHGLPGHVDAFRHLFLRQVVLFAQVP